jgi:hypothetical protein
MKSTSLTLAAAAVLAALPLANAQNVTATTDPVGFVTCNITAGTGVARSSSPISVPLSNPAPASGQVVGVISGLTANTVSNSNAGWTAGQLSSATSPTLLAITSGNASGRVFVVSSTVNNTATQLTIDAADLGSTDLTTLGITAGTDTYELLQAETLSSLFGVDGSEFLASTNAANADQIVLRVSGSNRNYYLSNSTTPNQWRRVGPNTASNNQVVKPDTGVIVTRLKAEGLSLTFTGEVPVSQREVIVSNSGVTTLSAAWPADQTLGNLGLNTIPGWTNGSAGDQVQFLVFGSPRNYYYDAGTLQWRRVGPGTASNSVVIPLGTVYNIIKKGTVSGSTEFTQAPPYSL